MAATLEAASGRLSPRDVDDVASAGELWSSRLLAAVLRDRELPAAWVDAREVMRTDARYGNAAPELEATRAAALQLVKPHVARGETG